jgi:hypothetical protein
MSTTRWELLAVILALERYAYFASGRVVHVSLDHKVLRYLKMQQMIPSVLVRWKERLDRFRPITIHYRPSTSMQVDAATQTNGEQTDARYEGKLLGKEYFSEEAWEDIQKMAAAA